MGGLGQAASPIAPRSQQSPQLATGAGKAQASGLQGAPHPSPPPAIYLVCGFETKTVNHIGGWKNEKHVVVSVLKQF